MLKFIIATLIFVFTAPSVWAAEALTGVYTCTDCVTYTVIMRDDTTARINMEVLNEPYHVYVLWLNGDYWLVTADEDGKNYVSNYSAAKRELVQTGRRAEDGLAFTASQIAAQRKVGHFTAAVFVFEDKFNPREYEFALSEKPEIYTISQILLPFVADFGHMPEFNMLAAFNENVGKQYGLVSLNDRFWLESLERLELDDDYFALPSNATEVSID